jgi:NADH-quinone oxidoreductase subunit M
VRVTALVGSLATLGFSLALLVSFEPALKGYQPQLTESSKWIPAFGISYTVGIDGISLFLVVLAALLTPISVLCSWTQVTKHVLAFHVSLLFLETGMIGVFVAMDLVLFYVFWEVMLIPMYLLIGIWGSGNRIQAAVKFFLYTVAGSLLMFLAILYLYGLLLS